MGRAGQHLQVCQRQRGKPIEKQCDGHNGHDRLAASTGFLLLLPEINHKYPHRPLPTARQTSTPTHTLTLREKKEERQIVARTWCGEAQAIQVKQKVQIPLTFYSACPLFYLHPGVCF